MSWLVVTVVVSLIGILSSVLGALLLARPRYLRTAPSAALPPPEGEAVAPRLSVVIPARDEAHNLPRLMRSLKAARASFAGEVEVIVVDDGSRDGTAAIARAHGAQVIEVHDKPADWLGKAWACSTGAQAARADLLCFLDADTELAPDALDRLVATREALGGALMVQPRHDPQRAYEQLSAYFNLIVVAGTGAFLPWPTPTRSGFGPAILLRREDYDAIGGHAAARHQVLEDIALADALRAADIPVQLVLGGASLRFRMYPGGLGQLAQGFAKGMASGASSAPVAVTTLFSLSIAGAFMTLGATLGLFMAPAAWPWVGAAWVATSLSLARSLRVVGRFAWWTWVLFPIPLVFFVALFASSAWATHVRKRVVWKGRALSTEGVGP